MAVVLRIVTGVYPSTLRPIFIPAEETRVRGHYGRRIFFLHASLWFFVLQFNKPAREASTLAQFEICSVHVARDTKYDWCSRPMCIAYSMHVVWVWWLLYRVCDRPKHLAWNRARNVFVGPYCCIDYLHFTLDILMSKACRKSHQNLGKNLSFYQEKTPVSFRNR